jgi:hypothetical protein
MVALMGKGTPLELVDGSYPGELSMVTLSFLPVDTLGSGRIVGETNDLS